MNIERICKDFNIKYRIHYTDFYIIINDVEFLLKSVDNQNECFIFNEGFYYYKYNRFSKYEATIINFIDDKLYYMKKYDSNFYINDTIFEKDVKSAYIYLNKYLVLKYVNYDTIIYDITGSEILLFLSCDNDYWIMDNYIFYISGSNLLLYDKNLKCKRFIYNYIMDDYESYIDDSNYYVEGKDYTLFLNRTLEMSFVINDTNIQHNDCDSSISSNGKFIKITRNIFNFGNVL